MPEQQKFWNRQIVLIVAWDFLINVERIFTLATLWLYLKQYWGGQVAAEYYGLIYFSFGLCHFLSTVGFTFLIRANLNAKWLIVCIEFLKLGGNILYFLAWHPAAVLAAKCLTGIGSCETPFFADLTNISDQYQRARFMILTSFSRLLGLTMGAIFVLIFSFWKFSPDKSWLNLSVYNSPGLVMTVLWTIHILCAIIFYPNHAKIRRESDDETPKRKAYSMRNILKRCSSYPIFTVLLTNFCLNIALFSVETFVPVVTYQHFQWNEVSLSYLYMSASLITFLSLSMVLLCVRCARELHIALMGMILLFATYIYSSVIYGFFGVVTSKISAPEVILSIFIHTWGIPMANICNESVFKKILPEDDIDIGHDAYHMVITLAYLIGPGLGAFLWMHGTIFYIILAAIIAVPTILMLCKIKSFIIDKPDDYLISKE